ncbi:MAG TPA: hypothetical protein PLL18_06180 [Flavobacteriales bacterium]|nr:hypothetical protein [Flavobacteriales bacterium]
MRHAILLLAGGLAASTSTAQLPRIVVQGAGAPQVFTDLAAAIAAAQPNDVLYCSAGTFSYTGGLQIDKSLHFIGAGIHPDSTAATGTTSFYRSGGGNDPLYILQSASGSTFTGIYFDNNGGGNTNWRMIAYGTDATNDQAGNILFQRCRFRSSRINLAFEPSNSSPAMAGLTTTFDECVISAVIYGGNRGVVATRCILDQAGTITANNAGFTTVDHCVFLGPSLGDCYTAQISNTIFTGYPPGNWDFFCGDCGGATVTNVLNGFAHWAYGGNNTMTLVNSQQLTDASTLFVSESNYQYEFSDDLHPAANSPAIGFANDGTDAGIYGSSSLYKPGAVSYNPHFLQSTIAPATNSNGALPVNIKVAAQTH